MNVRSFLGTASLTVLLATTTTLPATAAAAASNEAEGVPNSRAAAPQRNPRNPQQPAANPALDLVAAPHTVLRKDYEQKKAGLVHHYHDNKCKIIKETDVDFRVRNSEIDQWRQSSLHRAHTEKERALRSAHGTRERADKVAEELYAGNVKALRLAITNLPQELSQEDKDSRIAEHTAAIQRNADELADAKQNNLTQEQAAITAAEEEEARDIKKNFERYDDSERSAVRNREEARAMLFQQEENVYYERLKPLKKELRMAVLAQPGSSDNFLSRLSAAIQLYQSFDVNEAISRIKEEVWEGIVAAQDDGATLFKKYNALYDALQQGKLIVDAFTVSLGEDPGKMAAGRFYYAMDFYDFEKDLPELTRLWKQKNPAGDTSAFQEKALGPYRLLNQQKKDFLPSPLCVPQGGFSGPPGSRFGPPRSAESLFHFFDIPRELLFGPSKQKG